jgi:hypothetical protein
MCSQYYLILNKKLNIHELYNGHGIYRYSKVGINWRAYASFFIAVAPLLPGFSKSINNSLDVGGIWKIYTFSCIYGFVVSGLTYYLICRYVSDVGPAKIVSCSHLKTNAVRARSFEIDVLLIGKHTLTVVYRTRLYIHQASRRQATSKSAVQIPSKTRMRRRMAWLKLPSGPRS